MQGNVTAYVTGFTLSAYPLPMVEEANETARYVAEMDTVTLLPDLQYSNAATLSFCDSVRAVLPARCFCQQQLGMFAVSRCGQGL